MTEVPSRRYEPFEDEVDAFPDKPRNHLMFAAVRARDLPVATGLMSSGKPDVLATLRVPGTDLSFTTGVRRKTRNPVWKESGGGEYEAADDKGPGEIEVIVESTGVGGRKKIGAGILKLTTVRREFRVRHWLMLRDDNRKKVGFVCVVACWTHDPKLVFDPFAGPVQYKNRLQNELQIAVYRARGLPHREGALDTSLPNPSCTEAASKSRRDAWTDACRGGLRAPPSVRTL